MRKIWGQVQKDSNASSKLLRKGGTQFTCVVLQIHVRMARCLLRLQTLVQTQQRTHLLNMLVISLDAEPAIMVKNPFAFQKLYFITRCLHSLHRNFVLLLEAFHKSVHDKITFSNNQHVIHMNEGLLFQCQECIFHISANHDTICVLFHLQKHGWQQSCHNCIARWWKQKISFTIHPCKLSCNQPWAQRNWLSSITQLFPPRTYEASWQNFVICRHLWCVCEHCILQSFHFYHSAIASKRCNSSGERLGSSLLKGNMTRLVSSSLLSSWLS